MIQKMQEERVEIGNRVYDGTKWKRRDLIFYGDKKIGVITLSESDRMGTTTCIATSERRQGRAVAWCVKVSIERHVIARAVYAHCCAAGQNIAAAA